ncbi:hypothetical protein IQ254_19670 [Nodosilinea sp. LEGE 07088]|uniref:hypothetical protein n=1 Tax=Nodosilinea sp. LEGE 07088 TaxID=2777968 RepID=UPI00187DFB24|nr:hypothetical protein [Nodosilinea sp. LEGE 07088]MBE9139387.1 hypothetical protein [Nodosilinea sp. LEGE 07088]
MSFQRYPLATVQKVSQFIRETLVLPTHEQQPGSASLANDIEDDGPLPDSLNALGDLFRVGDMPEDNVPSPNVDGRWFVSTIDPAEALTKLPGLWMRPGIRLVTYLRQDTKGGMGSTAALPGLLSTTEYLEEAIEQATEVDQPPQPMGMLTNLMDGLDGDGSLASFLAASIFTREVREFGRFGRYARWTHHRFVAAPPQKISWQWRTKTPEDFSPKVVLRQDAEVIVEFYSCRVQKPVALFRHLDRYPANSYAATTQDQVVAVANQKSG